MQTATESVCHVDRSHAFVESLRIRNRCGPAAQAWRPLRAGSYQNLCLVIILLTIAGCGGDASMAEVRGTVSLDDKPIEKGAITFIPVDGKTKTAGAPIRDGQYVAQVPVGAMKVSISAPKVVGKVPLFDLPGSKMRDVTEEMIPPRYNEETELRLDVTPGRVEKDFELKSEGR